MKPFKITENYYEIDLPKLKAIYSRCDNCKINFAEIENEYIPECPRCGKDRKVIPQC